MWHELKTWLEAGGSLPDDPILAGELAISFELDEKGRLILLDSGRGPRAGALALSFAYPVAALSVGTVHETAKFEYDPFAERD